MWVFFLYYKVNIIEIFLLVVFFSDVILIVFIFIMYFDKKCESLEMDFFLIGIRSFFEVFWNINIIKKRNDNWLIIGYFFV